MKKYLTLAWILTYLVFNVKSQFVSQKDSLDGNNVNMLMYSNGIMSVDTAKIAAHFLVPKESGKSVIFSTSIWLAGINSVTKDSSLYASTFQQFNDVNSEGPISDNYDSDWTNRYGKLWKVSKSDVEFHKQNWNVMGYTAPSDILTWPGNGDVSKGEAFHLAPYVDFNDDGKYNPQFGDYPCIKGDQAIYTMANDDRVNPSRPFSAPFPVEVHLMAYQYATSDALNNTVFLEYKIVNRSGESFENVYFGLWQDYDVGCSNDDYVGCDSLLNVFYGYNGDPLDEDCFGALGYGTDLPFVGSLFLNRKMSHFISYERGTNPVRGDAFNLNHHFNYLQGRWKDGTPMVLGGNGHPSDTNASSTLANYMYPADPRDSVHWNETTALNDPFDRRGLGSTGPYNLAANAVLDIDIALVYSSDASKSRLDVFDSFKNDVQFVQNFYDNRAGYCPNWVTGVELVEATDLFEVYPNPAKNELFVKLGRAIFETDLILYDYRGKKVDERRDIHAEVTTFDVSNLASGLYFLQLRESGQESRVRKIVIR